MKKLLLSLMGVLCSLGMAWANQTELITGATLPDLPTASFDVENLPTGYSKDANNWVVFNPYEKTAANNDWWNATATNYADDYWSVPSNAVAPFVGHPNENGAAKVSVYTTRAGSSPRSHAFRFTNAVKFSILNGKNTIMSLYSVSGTTQTFIKTVSNTSGTREDVFDNLTASTEYVIYAYSSTDSNIRLFEVAVKGDDADAAPRVSIPTTATATVGTSKQIKATITAKPAVSSIQWYSCDDADKTNPKAVSGATTATLGFKPSTEGTRYYYCSATNSIGTTESNVCTVTVNAAPVEVNISFSNTAFAANGTGTASVDDLFNTMATGISGSNIAWGSAIKYNDLTYGGVSTSGTTTENDYVTITITPKKGITFTPTGISLGAIRSGTDGGELEVKANTTTLSTTISGTSKTSVTPGRNSSGKEKDGYTFSYAISNISATSTSPLTIKFCMKGMGASKGYGYRDVVVTGGYSGTVEEETMYTLAYTISPANGGTVIQSPVGTSQPEGTAVSFTATANTGYKFVNWTDDNNSNAVLGTDATYSINSLTANTAVTANFAQLPKITYTLGEGVLGQTPDAVYAEGSYTLPAKNYTVYKEGYTLTGWNDGTADHNLGSIINVTADVTLTPVFRQNVNTLADRSEAITLTWDAQRQNGCPTYTHGSSNQVLYFVTQATVNGETIDVAEMVTTASNNGCFRNANWTDWCQVNGTATFVLPSCKGATVKFESYSTSVNSTVDGVALTGNTSKTPSTTVQDNDATVTVEYAADASYFRYMQITLPVPPAMAVSVSTIGYATFYSNQERTIPEGTEVYTGKLNDSSLKLTMLEGVIPAKTAVIIKAYEGEYDFAISTTGAAAIANNDLKGVAAETATSTIEGGTVCVLGYENETVGFYKYTGENLAAYKAYLVVPENNPARSISIVFDDNEATAISQIENGKQTIANAKFIENGKMVIVKNGAKFNTAGQAIK